MTFDPTAPLTAEAAAQMVTRLRGQDAIPNRNEVADMLTALATQLAERDAELSACTETAVFWEGCAALNEKYLTAANLRIAALTEALKTVQDDCYFYKLDAETMFSVEQVLALTTDKEPT